MEVINIEKDTEIVISSQANDIQININNCRAIITDVSCSSKTINIVNGELEYSYIKGLSHEGKNIITTENGKCVIRVIDLESDNGSEIYSLITKGYKGSIVGIVKSELITTDSGQRQLRIYEYVKGADKLHIGYVIYTISFDADGTYEITDVDFLERTDRQP